MATEGELPEGFLDRIDPESFSAPDLMGLAILERGAPMSIEEIAARLHRIGVARSVASLRKSWHGGRFLRKRLDGRLEVIRDCVSYAARDSLVFNVRRQLGLTPPQAAAGDRESSEERYRRRTEEVRRRYLESAKAVLRCFFHRGQFGAATILDPDAREFHDFETAEEAVSALERVDIIIGVDPWTDLERLGVEPGSREIVDLSPPVKTIRLNQRGRTLQVTPDLVIRSSLRISRPLGDPARLREYVKSGATGKLFRRLRSDLKALWRLYEYGCLHNFVKIDWGFLNRIEGVGWNGGRRPQLVHVLKEAEATGAEIDVVVGSAPGWEEPWSRAVRMRAVRCDRSVLWEGFTAEDTRTGLDEWTDRESVVAIRFAREAPAPVPVSRPPSGECPQEAPATLRATERPRRAPPPPEPVWPEEETGNAC